MNFEQMSESLQEIIMKAIEITKAHQHSQIDTVHMLKAIFQHDVLDGLFKRVNINKQQALTLIDDEMKRMATSYQENPNLSNDVVSSLDKAKIWSDEISESYVSVASTFIALLFNKSYISKQVVKMF